MMATYRYTNPVNDYMESFGSVSAFFATLIFGPFYFLYRKVWVHAIISALLADPTDGLSWVIYPFFIKGILRKHYLSKGLIESIE